MKPSKILVAALVAISMASTNLRAVDVTYTMQTGNFNSLLTEKNNNPPYAGTYNNGATEVALYANGGSFGNTPGAADFQTFTTTGNGTNGAVRALQIGDTFTITAFTSANPSAGGYIGISFRDSTTYTNFFSSTDNATEARFQLDNTGNWKVYGNSTVESGSGSNVDRTFTIKITSLTTFDATIAGTTYYNKTMAAGGGSIDSFSIYNFGDTTQNSFWKNATLSNTGTVQLGYAAATGAVFTPGQITDGLAANSASTGSANAVFIGGDAGSQVNLSAANTYTGATTINVNAAGEAQNASALGSTAAGTTVTNGGSLHLYSSAGGITYDAEALTLNGLGVSGLNGALRSTGGNNTWTGAITLGASSRIQTDTTGGAGSLAISGNIAGGSNVLYIGANGAAVSISGAIGGAGGLDVTTTSLFKDGASALTLSGNNSYTGDTRITVGSLTVASGGTLGSGSDIFISSGATLSVNTNATVASIQETGTSNGGTIAIGSGAVLTVNGADRGTLFQNSISGAGGLTVSGSGNSSLSLYNPQTYTGTTTVSGAKISTGAAMSSAAYVVSGGTFEATADNILSDTATMTVNSGTFSAGGNDTIGALSGTGGTVSLASGKILTTSFNSASNSYAGTISGSGGLTKAGNGTLTLSGTNTYNGTTTVSAGNLTVTGNLTATGHVTVNGGSLLIGASNVINDSATVTLGGGKIAMGGAFTETLGALTLSANSTLDFGSSASQLRFGGFTPAGFILNIASWTASDHLIFAGTQAGNLSNFNFSGFGPGAAQLDIGGGSFEIVAVPEPGTMLAGLILLGGLAFAERRRIGSRAHAQKL